MNNLKVLALTAAVATASFGSVGVAQADVTANIGASSNYLWRGTSLSNEAAAISGGVDYSHESGAYAGVWQSSEGFTGSPETDLYVGFAGEAGEFGYDVGYVSYIYLQNDTADFDEIYLSGSFKFAELYYANSSDLDSDYIALTLSYDKFSFVYGDYSFDAGGDYSHFDLGVALTDELSLVYSQNDITGDDDGRLVISYALEFDVK